jgi:23S rRNA A2030 N6-methylase RlmJ
MNTTCKFIVLVGASLLAACASTPRSNVAVAAQEQTTARHVVNMEYVRSVERSTRMTGTQVVWINPPMKIDRGD